MTATLVNQSNSY